jgi:uncharacterized coiled-coil DUF342 family protein|tara:strand:+ start:164 stop:472 length:309 start_codon:yes stop_codon:yes gene_type:complete
MMTSEQRSQLLTAVNATVVNIVNGWAEAAEAADSVSVSRAKLRELRDAIDTAKEEADNAECSAEEAEGAAQEAKRQAQEASGSLDGLHQTISHWTTKPIQYR